MPDSRATRYTPAVTIVAAWISADTGVGPAMASGSQTCSGICADLPEAPMNNRMPTRLADTAGAASAMNAALIRSMSSVPSACIEHEHAEQEAGIADAVGDEGLLAGAGLVRILEPEADQQVGGEPHAFPADEQDEQRPAEHEQQHEEQEQVQIGEVAGVARVVLHVADRVDVDQRAHAGHDQRHHRAQAVEIEGDLERAAADDGPRVGDLDRRRSASRLQVEETFHRRDEGQRSAGRSRPPRRTACRAGCPRGRSAGSLPAAAGRSRSAGGSPAIP